MQLSQWSDEAVDELRSRASEYLSWLGDFDEEDDPQDFVDNWVYDPTIDWFKESSRDVTLFKLKEFWECNYVEPGVECTCSNFGRVSISFGGEDGAKGEKEDEIGDSDPFRAIACVDELLNGLQKSEFVLTQFLISLSLARIGHNIVFCKEAAKMSEAFLKNSLASYPFEMLTMQLEYALRCEDEGEVASVLCCFVEKLNTLERELLSDSCIERHFEKWKLIRRLH